jgi:hypothetical protein
MSKDIEDLIVSGNFEIWKEMPYNGIPTAPVYETWILERHQRPKQRAYPTKPLIDK